MIPSNLLLPHGLSSSKTESKTDPPDKDLIMDQIDELKKLRDGAKDRLETAKRALSETTDGKLVSTLEALIKDLETSPEPPQPPRFSECEETLEELIVHLEFPDGIADVKPTPPPKETNYLEEPMSMDAFLDRLEEMTAG